MKQFIFLYPIAEIIDFEISNYGWSTKGGVTAFRQKYKSALNKCIDVRYRRKGFGINYVVFNGSPVSEIVEIQPTDRVIEVEINFETHTTKGANGEYPYPDEAWILDQLNGTRVIRIAGFHRWDCVERLARRAREKRLKVLIDEDLTEFFGIKVKYPGFRLEQSLQLKQSRI